MDDYRMVDAFDRIRAGMDGRPDVTRTRISTVRNIESVREKDEGDTIFLEVASKDGNVRIVLPPKVANVIARQRDALVAKVRSKAAKEQAAQRKADGIEPFGGKRFTRTA